MEIKTSRHPLINTLANTNLIRKPHSIREVEERNRCRPASDIVLVAEVWELTVAEYRSFCNSCLESRPEFKGKGGCVKYNGTQFPSVIALCCPNRPTLLIDPEGCDYARYIGLLNKF